MAIRYISIFSNLRPWKIFPNWDFGFKNEPSGNPDAHRCAHRKQWLVSWKPDRGMRFKSSTYGVDVIISSCVNFFGKLFDKLRAFSYRKMLECTYVLTYFCQKLWRKNLSKKFVKIKTFSDMSSRFKAFAP
jgi:hypothetical protein